MKPCQENLTDQYLQQKGLLSLKMQHLSTHPPHSNQLSTLHLIPFKANPTQSSPRIVHTAPSLRKRTEIIFQQMRFFEVLSLLKGRKGGLRQLPSRMMHTFTGDGMLVLPNGKKFKGEWAEGAIIGEAEVTYPNGNIYKGPLYNFQKHGWGVLQLRRGEKYEGQFVGGDFHGQGTLFSKEGRVIYKGEWRRGKRDSR